MKNSIQDIPIKDKLNLTMQEASVYSNIGINKIRKMTDEPSCPFVLYIGKRKVIKRKEFELYLGKVSEI
ncbi:MAG: DNA-binding protein [Lachnospiraceae bacterium]|nr:DNA-binding protein [Lachnospiraceae bacterium]